MTLLVAGLADQGCQSTSSESGKVSGTRLTLAQKAFLKELATIKGSNVSEEVRQAVLDHIRRQDESLVVAIETAL